MKIKINGLTWKVKMSTNEEMAKINDRDPKTNLYFGLTVFDTQTIHLLLNPVDMERFRRTIIHELLHAIIYSFGYEDTFSEESLCNLLAAQYHFISKLSLKILENFKKTK